jgi:hypothetical protein
MRQLIDALPADAGTISKSAVKSLLLALLSATHVPDVSTAYTRLRQFSPSATAVLSVSLSLSLCGVCSFIVATRGSFITLLRSI